MRLTVAAPLPFSRENGSAGSAAHRRRGRAEHDAHDRPPGRGLEHDLAAHHCHQLARDREPEPAAGRDRAVAAVEAVEDVRRVLGARSRARRPRPRGSACSRSAQARSVTCVPSGVCMSALSTSARTTWSTRSSSARATGCPRRRRSTHVPFRSATRAELGADDPRDLAEVDGLVLDVHPARVEPGEIEQVGGELRQPVDLLAHRLEELLPRRLVDVLVRHQLEEAAEREERRAQLVRRVRDELAARAVELARAGRACARTRPRARRARRCPCRSPARRSGRPRSARRRARAAGSAARASTRPRSRPRRRTAGRSGPRSAAGAR